MKHNKKRNTAFLYEVLVREGTKAALNKDTARLTEVKSIIVEYFNYSTNLGAELYLFSCLRKMDIEKSLADKYLTEVKSRYSSLNKKDIFNEQTKLINKINKTLGSQTYNNFIPFYKELATISQILNDNLEIKEKILLEQEILKKVENRLVEDDTLKHVDNIVFKTFVNKFNDKYNCLLSEQKELLTKYINSFADDGLELKAYLNEELPKLAEKVNKSLALEEVKSDKGMAEKTKKILDLIAEFKTKKDISTSMMENLLKIQQFVSEAEKND